MSALKRLSGPLRRTPLALLLGAALVSCGGGVSVGIGIGIGDGFDDGRAPSVSLAVSQTVAAPGQILRLSAAASDDSGIEQVAFFRLDNGSARLLFADGDVPYEHDTVVPNDGRTQVQYFARATDFHGRRSDSAVQTVTLQGS